LNVRVDRSVPNPYTTEQLIASLEDIELCDRTVLVAQWVLPQRTDPLEGLLTAIQAGGVQAVVFTSASQVEHLCLVAEASNQRPALIDALCHGPVVAAVGPICAQALRERGIQPEGGIIEPNPPKMVPLVRALAQHMVARRSRSAASPRASHRRRDLQGRR
jgi:uroporphyrinogen-III synthase